MLVNEACEQQDVSSCFVIKKHNYCMCLSTLIFLDITNYLVPGFSCDMFLRAFGCKLTKGLTFEYMDDVRKLDEAALPPTEAFYNRLKGENISDDDYARCQKTLRDNGMTTMRDFLVWYNNRDVVPFLEAIDKQFAFYQQRHIDMFRDGISVPGLTLLHLFNDLTPETHFNEKNKDLHHLTKEGIEYHISLVQDKTARLRQLRSIVPPNRQLRCQRIVPMSLNAKHTDGLVHAPP